MKKELIFGPFAEIDQSLWRHRPPSHAACRGVNWTCQWNPTKPSQTSKARLRFAHQGGSLHEHAVIQDQSYSTLQRLNKTFCNWNVLLQMLIIIWSLQWLGCGEASEGRSRWILFSSSVFPIFLNDSPGAYRFLVAQVSHQVLKTCPLVRVQM